MSKIDFDKYKPYLKQYLSLKGVDISINPTFCIDPNHDNKNTPSMQLHDDGFNCLSCGAKGDTLDSCGLITGITNKIDQFNEVEKTLTGIIQGDFIPKKKPELKIDPEAVKLFEDFVRTHKGRERGVKKFLDSRGYPPEIKNKMLNKFGYWPGYDEARKIIPGKKLLLAGIPEKAWYHSGVVVRLGFGYKLMWYDKTKCEKRNSLSAKTFPTPKKENLTGDIILVEAELSALSMLSAGFENVYSTGGVNGITKYNVEKLMSCDSITFLFDGDNKGRFHSGLDPELEGSTRAKPTFQKILDAGYTGEIHAVRLPESSDADDFLQAGKIKELRDIINKPVLVTKKKPAEVKQKTKTDNPFQFLGYDSRAYYVLPKFQQVPLKISRGEQSIKNWLFELATEDWWFSKFSIEVEAKEGELKTVFDRKEAMAWFREKSYQAGIYDEKRIKGVGAYIDNGEIIFNTGRDIKVCGNGIIGYDEWDSGANFYVKSKRYFKTSDAIWTTEDGKKLWDNLGTFSFEKKMDKIAVLGFSVMAPFSSILFRRPSIWITAQKGLGKSYLLDNFIVPAVGGDEYSFYHEGLSSEAFIRQSLKKDTVTVILDEFEGKDKLEKMNIVRVLNLMRSSYGGKTMGKGSASHDPIEFNMKSMFCFGSINVQMDNEADRSRVHVCRMKKSNGVFVPPEDFTGLRMRTFNSLPKILEDIKLCKKHILTLGLNDRIGDTYSPLLVGAWSMLSDKKFMMGDNKKILDYFTHAILELTGGESIDDEDRIIERILQQRIRIDTATEKTIAEMLIIEDGPLLRYSEELQRYGLKRYTMKGDKSVLAISHNSPDISHFLENTPFSEYKEVIQRNRFVIDKSYPVKMAGKQERSVLLDWEKFENLYLSDKTEENTEDSPF